jgi:hypothetical protein
MVVTSGDSKGLLGMGAERSGFLGSTIFSGVKVGERALVYRAIFRPSISALDGSIAVPLNVPLLVFLLLSVRVVGNTTILRDHLPWELNVRVNWRKFLQSRGPQRDLVPRGVCLAVTPHSTFLRTQKVGWGWVVTCCEEDGAVSFCLGVSPWKFYPFMKPGIIVLFTPENNARAPNRS